MSSYSFFGVAFLTFLSFLFSLLLSTQCILQKINFLCCFLIFTPIHEMMINERYHATCLEKGYQQLTTQRVSNGMS